MDRIADKVAKVARLKLTGKESEEYSRDLESILSAFKDMEKVDTENVEPSFRPIDAGSVTRDDRIEDSLSQEEALKNARQKEKGFFRGPKAI